MPQSAGLCKHAAGFVFVNPRMIEGLVTQGGNLRIAFIHPSGEDPLKVDMAPAQALELVQYLLEGIDCMAKVERTIIDEVLSDPSIPHERP